MSIEDPEAKPITPLCQRAGARSVATPLNAGRANARERKRRQRAKARSPIAAVIIEGVDLSTQDGVINALELAARLAAAEPYAARTLCMAAKTASDILAKRRDPFSW